MQPTLNVWQSLGNDALLRPKVIEMRRKITEMMLREKTNLIDYYNRRETPRYLIPEI